MDLDHVAGAFSFLAALLLLGGAVLVVRWGPRQVINQRLSWVMAFEAFFLFTMTAWFVGDLLPGGSAIGSLMDVVGRFTVSSFLVLNVFYLRFLARLDGALAAALHSPWTWVFLAPLVGLAASVPVLVALDLLTLRSVLGMRVIYLINFGPLLLLVGLTAYALVVVFRSYVLAPKTGPLRRRARVFAVAFGIRDGLWLGLLILATLSLQGSVSAVSIDEEGVSRASVFDALRAAGDVVLDLGPPFISVLFVALLLYGVLAVQLFDIHVRFRSWTARGLWAGLVGITFFAVSEGLEALLSVGGVVPGVVAAGVASLALFPLRHLSHWAANVLLGDHPDVDEAELDPKHQLYQALAQQLEQDDMMPEAEREAIRGLMAQVGPFDDRP